MKHKIALVSVLISMCHLAYAQANKDSLEQTLRANNIEGKIISNSDLGSGLSMVVIEVGTGHQ